MPVYLLKKCLLKPYVRPKGRSLIIYLLLKEATDAGETKKQFYIAIYAAVLI